MTTLALLIGLLWILVGLDYCVSLGLRRLKK
jgi:hypothetical protein